MGTVRSGNMFFHKAVLLLPFLVVLGCSSPTLQQQAENQHAATPIPHPRRTIPELIRDISKDPIEVHIDHTPAGDELVEIGEPAIPALLEVMLADDWRDRCCAERVLWEITLLQYGWRIKGGWGNV